MVPEHSPPPPGLLSINEAARYLGGIGRTKLYELIHAGAVRSIKVGRRHLVPVASLDEFIAAQLEAKRAAL